MANISSSSSGQVPVLILKEGVSRSRGKTALSNNIMAARVIGEVLRSTLGPRGMDKMLVDSIGDITITNDGATILQEMDVEHPAAKIIVEASKATDNEVGDGTTSVAILTSEMLKKAESLLDKNIHPTAIISGYKKALEKAIGVLNEIGVQVSINDRNVLRNIINTTIRSKLIFSARDVLVDMIIDAVSQIAEKKDNVWDVDIDQIQMTKKTGESVLETKLLKGLIIDKEVVHSGMPKKVENAKIAIVDSALEIEKTEMDAEIRIKNPLQMKAFLDEETNMLKAMVGKIKSSGANVLACQKGIDDIAQHFLAKEGILAVRRVKQSDMEKLAKATGGKVVTNLDDLNAANLGFAKLVEEGKIGDDKMVFVEGCKNPKSVGILVRGGTERIIDEAERSIHDALCTVADIYKLNKVVAGGGAIEAELAKRIRNYASKIGGREQLAVEAFAEALEEIPATLADNSGIDKINILVEMRATHEKSDGLWYGININNGKVTDMMKEGVIEPLSVKLQIVKAATESACLILRIDDVIASSKEKAPEMPPGAGGMPGGYPGMY